MVEGGVVRPCFHCCVRYVLADVLLSSECEQLMLYDVIAMYAYARVDLDVLVRRTLRYCRWF